MTPKELYPIGTQLITRRLNQAALAHELGFLIETQASNRRFYPCFNFGFDASGLFHFDTWRVIVTEENQQRAPMIKWDEVILPAKGEQS